MHAILDNSSDYCYVKNASLQLIYVNRAFCDRFQLEREHCIGKTFDELFPSIVVEPIRQYELQILQSKVNHILNDEFLVGASGSALRATVRRSPLLNPDGAVCGVICQSIHTIDPQDSSLYTKNFEKEFSLFDTIRDVYIEVDLNGVILEASRSIEYLALIPRTQIIGSNVLAAYKNPKDRERLLEQLFAKGYVQDFEVELLFPPNRTRFVSMSSKLMVDGDGTPTGIAGVLRDITERHQAEMKWLQSEEMLRVFIDSLPDFICYKDVQGRWLLTNQFGLDLFQLNDIDYIGKTDLELGALVPFHRPAFEYCYDTDMAVWRKGVVNRGDEHIPQPDGSIRSFDVIKLPLYYASGEPRGLAVVGRDISDRIQQEHAFVKLASAINHSHNTVMITDRTGLIEYVNPSFVQTSGYTLEESIGKNPRFLSSGEHSKEFYQEMWQTILSGNTWTGRIINLRKDGSKLIEDTSISPVFDKIGNLVSFIAIMNDVTSDVLLQEEMRHLEEQYYQSQKMEAMGQLTSGIAHDFNNILTPIIGFSELLLGEDHLTPTDRMYCGEIKSASLRAKELVHQLLSYSRKQTSAPDEIDLNKHIRNIEGMLRNTISREVDIHVNLSDCPLLVRINSSQLDQVLLNLVVNARDAMSGSGTITITTQFYDDCKSIFPNADCMHKKVAEIAVRDTGCGMDAEIMARIFDPFFTTKEIGKGTGLGLSTCHTIVEKHGGKIKLESTVGVGTTFRIFLPIQQEGE